MLYRSGLFAETTFFIIIIIISASENDPSTFRWILDSVNTTYLQKNTSGKTKIEEVKTPDKHEISNISNHQIIGDFTRIHNVKKSKNRINRNFNTLHKIRRNSIISNNEQKFTKSNNIRRKRLNDFKNNFSIIKENFVEKNRNKQKKTLIDKKNGEENQNYSGLHIRKHILDQLMKNREDENKLGDKKQLDFVENKKIEKRFRRNVSHKNNSNKLTSKNRNYSPVVNTSRTRSTTIKSENLTSLRSTTPSQSSYKTKMTTTLLTPVKSITSITKQKKSNSSDKKTVITESTFSPGMSNDALPTKKFTKSFSTKSKTLTKSLVTGVKSKLTTKKVSNTKNFTTALNPSILYSSKIANISSSIPPAIRTPSLISVSTGFSSGISSHGKLPSGKLPPKKLPSNVTKSTKSVATTETSMASTSTTVTESSDTTSTTSIETTTQEQHRKTKKSRRTTKRKQIIATKATRKLIAAYTTKESLPIVNNIKNIESDNTQVIKAKRMKEKLSVGMIISIVLSTVLVFLMISFVGLFIIHGRKRAGQPLSQIGSIQLETGLPSPFIPEEKNDSGTSDKPKEWAPDRLRATQFKFKGPLKIPVSQDLTLFHELENDNTPPSVQQDQHVEFVDNLNEVNEMGSEVEEYVNLKHKTGKKKKKREKKKKNYYYENKVYESDKNSDKSANK